MSAIHKDIQRAFVLWLSGARFVDIQAVAEVATLMERGVMVELEPSPITGAVAQYYQIFSGQLPAYFGFFDTLVPVRQLSHQQQGASDYAVVEKLTGRDAAPKMLPDLLHAAGWTVEYEEVSPADLASSVQGLTQSESITAVCKIVKCPPGIGTNLSRPVPIEKGVGADLSRPAPIYRQESIAETLCAAREWVGDAGLLAVLSDI